MVIINVFQNVYKHKAFKNRGNKVIEKQFSTWQ